MRTYKKKQHAKKKRVRTYIPKWLPAIDHIVKRKGLSSDRMRLVLHQLYRAWLRAVKKNKHSTFFPVHTVILAGTGTHRYAEYLRALVDAGVIEKRISIAGGAIYLPGVKSSDYRFIPPAEGIQGRMFRVEYVHDYRCIQSVLRTRQKYQPFNQLMSESLPLNNTHRWLKEFTLETCIDVNQEIQESQAYLELTQEQKEQDLEYIQAINERELFWFKVDSFGKRCHTPLTTLKSFYRPGIRFTRRPYTSLVNIDISNSQPYFLAALGERNLIELLIPEFRALIPLVNKYASAVDFKKYCNDCAAGLLYETIARELRSDRKTIKDSFYRAVLFSKFRVYGYDMHIRRAFKKLYPSVYRFLFEVKKMKEADFPLVAHVIRNKSGTRFEPCNIIPCVVQRLESALITEVGASRLIQKGLIPFITVHDSFLILPENTDHTLIEISNAFTELGMTPPKMKPEPLKIGAKVR